MHAWQDYDEELKDSYMIPADVIPRVSAGCLVIGYLNRSMLASTRHVTTISL